MRVAALTMVYNEPVWARVWSEHYARQVGAENCFLIDHGSDDGSTDRLSVNVERLTRSSLDEMARAATVGLKTATLLRHYDAVVHSDADELVFADPAKYRNLAVFAEAVREPVVTAAGMDLQHLPEEEPALDASRPVGAQRRWVRFSAAMCKPVLVRRPVTWSQGFHTCEAAPVWSGLYLVHLRYADLGLGLERLAKTRGLALAHAGINPHQRVPDQEFADMVRRIATLPREEFELDVTRRPLRAWLDRVRAGRESGGSWINLAGDRLWELPARARDIF